VASAVGIGIVLWLPPVADQLTNRPGNIRQLIDHFGSPPEAAIGLGDGVRLLLQHLDVWAGLGGQLAGTGRFVSSASTARGAIVLVIWLIAVAVAFRVGSRALRALHVVAAVALLLGVASMARIFGRPWFYLTLWAWGVTTLLAGAVLWSAVAWWQHRHPDGADRLATRVALLAAGVTVVTSVATAVAFADAHPPEQRLSNALGALAAPTYRAIVDKVGPATGKDGRYVVRWSDAADIGSPGFGLLDELERRGLDVAADETSSRDYTASPGRRRRRSTWPRAATSTGGEHCPAGRRDVRLPHPGAARPVRRHRVPADRPRRAMATDLVPLVDTNLAVMIRGCRRRPARPHDPHRPRPAHGRLPCAAAVRRRPQRGLKDLASGPPACSAGSTGGRQLVALGRGRRIWRGSRAAAGPARRGGQERHCGEEPEAVEPFEPDRPPRVGERLLLADEVHDDHRAEGQDPHGHQAGQARSPEHAEHDGGPDRRGEHPGRADQEAGRGDPDDRARDQRGPRGRSAREAETGQGVGGQPLAAAVEDSERDGGEHGQAGEDQRWSGSLRGPVQRDLRRPVGRGCASR
jgi:hypothetical protein